MGKTKQIAEGWANYLFNRQNDISQERMGFCNECEHISTKHESNRPDVHCTECGCTLAAKTRSLDSECPIGLWKAVKIEKDGNTETNHNKKDSAI